MISTQMALGGKDEGDTVAHRDENVDLGGDVKPSEQDSGVRREKIEEARASLGHLSKFYMAEAKRAVAAAFKEYGGDQVVFDGNGNAHEVLSVSTPEELKELIAEAVS